MVVSDELTSRVTGQPVIGSQLALHKPDGSFDGTRRPSRWMCIGSIICCAPPSRAGRRGGGGL